MTERQAKEWGGWKGDKQVLWRGGVPSKCWNRHFNITVRPALRRTLLSFAYCCLSISCTLDPPTALQDEGYADPISPLTDAAPGGVNFLPISIFEEFDSLSPSYL